MPLKRFLVGSPLKTAQEIHERLSKRAALAVLSSDPLSSVAYATEEILRVLVLAGSAALVLSLPISFMIVLLLLILTTSYRQTIFAYPTGGGAYIVAKDNLGKLPGLTAGASLMIDYVLTVAVSIAAGVAALTSAVPSLFPYHEGLALMVIVALMIINLRGVRELGLIFATPTHLFIGAILLVLIIGFIQILLGHAAPTMPAAGVRAAPEASGLLMLFLLLRAFSAGCTALTGVETISNSISVFRPPEPKNAATTMIAMGVVLGTLFMGISTLAYHYGILPQAQETVLSQLTGAVLGRGFFYYVVQAATMLILFLAANSSFAGFPRMASIMARDGYMPRQMTNRGDRLVFSNGILLLGTFAFLLILLFSGDTHALIPLYAVGVFLSFTLSQAGMVRHWLTQGGKHWRQSLIINGLGALTTGVATLVIAGTKFVDGAWIVIGLIPLLILGFRAMHAHYAHVAEQVALERNPRPALRRQNTFIVPIGGVNRAVLRAISYARGLSSDVQAILVDVNEEETSRIRREWERYGCGLPLVVLPSPYRSVVGPLSDYIEELLQKDDGWVTVVIPEVVPAHWWQNTLHNQRALMLKTSLLFKERVIVVDVPFHLGR